MILKTKDLAGEFRKDAKKRSDWLRLVSEIALYSYSINSQEIKCIGEGLLFV